MTITLGPTNSTIPPVDTVHTRLVRPMLAAIFVASLVTAVHAQSGDSNQLHWRAIGPTRAGRARALAGVPSQPNVFYAGFDNGGVWRSTDYGSTWVPLFDSQPTGSIGAIGVAPSDPNVIYVGSGAGIIRPDLAIGDGIYKSTDGGKTWTHLGLRESQMIAMIDVDPTNPNRLFVAALGHPYGPNAERGIFRSTDGGQTFQKVLYKDEYTSGNDVRIDPSNVNIVYATLWQQQQSFIEGGGFGGAGTSIYKSVDGGTTWKPLTEGLPQVIQANLAIAPSNSRTIYATIAGATTGALVAGDVGGGRAVGPANVTGTVAFYRSTDAGEHWAPVLNPGLTAGGRGGGRGGGGLQQDPRPLARIGGGDLPTLAVDSKNENVVYSASTVLWRTEDGGVTWSAVRGAPGGDDYQKIWVNPNNPNILLVVSDQGAVISANRGTSWSNWYTQPTAAMYHVSTDNSFPYRVCSGQQDSGSACVDSRGNDGEITFHDWHPVNIQEYGEAAPDPKDPDMVYGSQRTGVSLYNRKTGQTSAVGPSAEQRAEFNRNVRTMPIEWSPVDHSTLFYASNAVWKSTDHAHSWTRISGDLTRQTWEPPASAGKYSSVVAPAPLGSITALSPSPRDIKTIWTGSDDGVIQVTTDGGATWKNVTPPAIKPWTRIFNIEAGHFDGMTAYAAANTLRIDDANPHFWRTHDGGKTWTEINTGIAGGAAANSIREDPRKKGLLYAATDVQVWVSFDDGDHWQSLRFNMPAISVRDLELKDDSTCLCADLVAGTHGRGFWILDDVTPLRQQGDARAAQSSRAAFLFKPGTAVRVRYGMNDPTPWPPEWPAGENPMPGGIIDYNLADNASAPVTLEILDGAKVIRHYSSADPVMNPHPALDPEAYDQVCRKTPSAPDCALPLYWPGAPIVLSQRAGFHRFSWDLRMDPIGAGGGGGGGGGAGGAVPHHTYPTVASPWAAPGNYTVRLTVDGKQYTQPITLRLDPRVKTPAPALAQLASMTREMYNGAAAARAAYEQARALSAKLESAGGDDAAAFKREVDSLAPPAPAGGRGGGRGFGGGGGGGGRGRGGAPEVQNLETVTTSQMAAAMAMQSAEAAPTASQIAAVTKARGDAAAVMKRWATLKTTGLAGLNAKRKKAGQTTIDLPAGE
jgi:photosystem II stability/assembly factor-like uncharacterized protein